MSEKVRELVIYQTRSGAIKLNADFAKDTIWATQAQIVKLFGIDQSVVSRHINNIFKSGEVAKKSNMQKTHIANSDKLVAFYSLDIMLAVGYRANSATAIEFRKWATKLIKQHIVQGYTVNRERLNQLHKMLEIISRSEISEVSGVAQIVANYANALNLLEQYDENKLPAVKGSRSKWQLNYENSRKFLDEIDFAKTNSNFAKERNDSFRGIVAGLYQTFAGAELYKSTEEKAANLLYQIIKDHPFVDGNKRIGVLAMIVTLAVNGIVVTATNDDLIDLGFGLAEGRLTVEDVVDWVTSHTSGR